MLLAPEALRRRITRLQALIAHLERLPAIDMAEYGKDIALQLRVERVVQLIAQTVVDVGETILDRERSLSPNAVRMPESGNLLESLAQRGVVPLEVATRLGDIAAFALRLTHEHEEIDAEEVWRIWREKRGDYSALASAFAAYLGRNKGFL